MIRSSGSGAQQHQQALARWRLCLVEWLCVLAQAPRSEFCLVFRLGTGALALAPHSSGSGAQQQQQALARWCSQPGEVKHGTAAGESGMTFVRLATIAQPLRCHVSFMLWVWVFLLTAIAVIG